MSLNLLQLRIKKIIYLLKYPSLLKALIQNQIFAAVEHEAIIRNNFSTIIDIGANKGQFALASRAFAPKAQIISFEPLPKPAETYRNYFKNDPGVKLYQAAVGPALGKELMHISARDDCSSLLPMGAQQIASFPGTQEVGTTSVDVAPLDFFLKSADIIAPALLKIDVQGYEFEVLMGCESLLRYFDHIYCECSFIELYTGQKMANSIVDWLSKSGFKLSGTYNLSYGADGKAIQADFMFDRIACPSLA